MPSFGNVESRTSYPRKYWVPEAVFREIQNVGVARRIGFDLNAKAELEIILREIELIEWSQVWGYNKSIPV